MQIDRVSMREHSEEAAYECQGAFRHTQREKNRGRRCVCSCQRGNRAGVSALHEADVSDVRGKCQSVVPLGVAECQRANHAVFRCLSLQSHSQLVSGDI